MRIRGAVLRGTGQVLQDARAAAVVLKVAMMVMHHHISWLRSHVFYSLVDEPFSYVYQLSGMVLWTCWKAV